MPVRRLGINDRYGESGEPAQLMDYFDLTGELLAPQIEEFIEVAPQYHRQ